MAILAYPVQAYINTVWLVYGCHHRDEKGVLLWDKPSIFVTPCLQLYAIKSCKKSQYTLLRVSSPRCAPYV